MKGSDQYSYRFRVPRPSAIDFGRICHEVEEDGHAAALVRISGEGPDAGNALLLCRTSILKGIAREDAPSVAGELVYTEGGTRCVGTLWLPSYKKLIFAKNGQCNLPANWRAFVVAAQDYNEVRSALRVLINKQRELWVQVDKI